MMRIACLRVPRFPLQALRRAEPELDEAPLAVASGPAPHDPLVAVAAEAAELGACAGMTRAQARQVAPGVVVRVASKEVLEAAGEALADVAMSFSPRLRRARPGEVLLDVGGLERRIGSEERIAHELLRACHRVGLAARVGIASDAGVARIASHLSPGRLQVADSRAKSDGRGEPPEADRAGLAVRQSSVELPADPGIAIVPPGSAAEILAPLPLTLLEPSPELAARLLCWGLRRVGDLAELPREEIALRLGKEGLALHRLACGRGGEVFIPDPVRETLREGVSLEEPLVALEAFLFVLRGLLARLEGRLELRGEGFSSVLLELHLEGGERREYRVNLVAPVREVTAVLALVRLRLEAAPPGGPVEGVTALVTPGTVRLTQGSLFGPRLPAPGRLAMTMARLAALVGPDRIGAPAVADRHRPGAYSVLPFRPAGEVDDGGGDDRRPPGIALPPVLRALRPPRKAQVLLVGGRPAAVRVDGLGGPVSGCAGPYRVIGEWWGDDAFARDEYDVATRDGVVLRVFFDRRERAWYADGIYD